ncbi:MAG: hypothetical protein Q9162_001729 [Coniocarpon cinnabarinum]
MSTARTSHVERTATAPRDPNLHAVTISRIDLVTPSIRLLRFDVNDATRGLKFTPGQWLDVFTPTQKAGGFTLISPPSSSLPLSDPSSHPNPHGQDQRLQQPPYLELAIQRSSNPPALYLWRPISELLGASLDVRVGGSFVYPPGPYRDGKARDVRNLVLVAGGVGVNPFLSMLAQVAHQDRWPERVSVLYGVRVPRQGVDGVWGYDRMRRVLGGGDEKGVREVRVFAGSGTVLETGDGDVVSRRMTLQDVKTRVCDEDGAVR